MALVTLVNPAFRRAQPCEWCLDEAHIGQEVIAPRHAGAEAFRFLLGMQPVAPAAAALLELAFVRLTPAIEILRHDTPAGQIIKSEANDPSPASPRLE
ncbi:MAG: hypothetical protein ACK4FG_01130 [Brevundimonas sp.]